MKIRRHTSLVRGFTLIEILIVVTIVGLLATIAICQYSIARDNSRLQTIRHNLRQLDSAKEQWAMDQKISEGTAVEDVSVLKDYLRGGQIVDVINETYEPNAVGTPPDAALPSGVKLGPYGPGGTIPAP